MKFGNGNVPVIPGNTPPGATRCQHCYADIIQPVKDGSFFSLGARSVDVAAGRTTSCEGLPGVPHKPLPKVSDNA